MGESKLTIVLVSDPDYLKYLRAILKSINQNCVPELYEIHIHLVNIGPKSPIVMELASLTKFETIFTHDMLNLDMTPQMVKKINKSEKRAYCANIRIKVMLELLQKGTPYLLYLDCDSLVRKDITELFDLIKQCDMTFYIEKRSNKNLSAKSGAIGVKNGPDAINIFNEYHALLSKSKYRIWGRDQRHLLELYHKHLEKGTGGVYKPLPHKFLDWLFKPDSPIWTGKGPRKEHNKIYVKEFNKYGNLK